MSNNQFVLSTNLKDALMTSGSLKGLLDNSVINIYVGTPPTSADPALSGATLLAQLCKGDSSVAADLVWDGTASPGALLKPSADTWSTPTGTGIVASGTPKFFIINSQLADNNSTTASGTNYRVLGLCGPDGSYAMQVGALTAGQPLAINSATLGITP